MSLDFASRYYTNWTEQPPAFAHVPLTPPYGSQTQLYIPGNTKHPIWGPRKVTANRQPWDAHVQLAHTHTALRPSESIWGPPSPPEKLSPATAAPQLTPPSPPFYAQSAYKLSSLASHGATATATAVVAAGSDGCYSPPSSSTWNSHSVNAEFDSLPSSPLLAHSVSKLSISRPDEIQPCDYSTYDELVAAMASAYSPLCIVQFKGNRLEVFANTQQQLSSPNNGSVYVVVDADRGRDLGLLVAENVSPEEAALVRWRQFQKQSEALQLSSAVAVAGACPSGESAPSVSAVAPKPIIRSARPCEVQLLDAKQTAEAKAVGLCNQKVAERGLKMSIVDAEYQWDRRKLTFYYCANQRVDFRDLIRDLFRIYKTRIWMCAVSETDR